MPSPCSFHVFDPPPPKDHPIALTDHDIIYADRFYFFGYPFSDWLRTRAILRLVIS
ncbi:hypothetical protein B296_00030436 [Ensete ventricosum]|uniref:Uncharacterized protein n=1 Tax=Ensete ventricosum TaxID=4639 RepID=A0A426ZXJ4_ENSVE|nr:hypothetical protein B296_00030436 [Ensete ventricosum]